MVTGKIESMAEKYAISIEDGRLVFTTDLNEVLDAVRKIPNGMVKIITNDHTSEYEVEKTDDFELQYHWTFSTTIKHSEGEMTIVNFSMPSKVKFAPNFKVEDERFFIVSYNGEETMIMNNNDYFIPEEDEPLAEQAAEFIGNFDLTIGYAICLLWSPDGTKWYWEDGRRPNVFAFKCTKYLDNNIEAYVWKCDHEMRERRNEICVNSLICGNY